MYSKLLYNLNFHYILKMFMYFSEIEIRQKLEEVGTKERQEKHEREKEKENVVEFFYEI